jgi:uncharacterized membrane protein YvlD (DUF360 family)
VAAKQRNPLQRIGHLWRTQVAMAREWKPESHGRWRRLALVWLVDALALLFVVWLLPGVTLEVEGGGAAVFELLLFAAFIGLVNAFIRPVIIYFALPLAFITGGLFALVINAVLLQLTSAVIGAVIFDGFLSAFFASILMALANTVISFAVNLNDDDSFYFALLARMARESDAAVTTDRPGLVILQVDGLAAPILRQAIHTGTTPFIASLVRSHGHRLLDWEAGLPSNTPASQAGILHGNNAEIPAFRWYDKSTGRILVANHPKDATAIEQTISTKRGILADGGFSLVNLFSGNATEAFLTNSRMAEVRGDVGKASQSLYGFLLSPYQMTRTIILVVREVILERRQARRQERRGVEPRVHRGWAFAGMRAISCIAFTDIAKTLIVQGMYQGRNVMYADILSYDELAHHAGPQRPETLGQLEDLDTIVRSIMKSSRSAPRRYELAIVSDHGQSMGATFRQRYGKTLQEVVQGFIAGDATVLGGVENEESWGKVNVFLGELSKAPGITAAVTRTALRNRRTADGEIEVRKAVAGHDKEAEEALLAASAEAATKDNGGAAAKGAGGEAAEPVPAAIVLPSGNWATIHLTAQPYRMTLEEIEEAHPGLITSLAAHPGIGLVLVRSSQHGAVVIGPDGIRYLADDRVTGEDPLRHFAGHPADHLRRVDSFANCADICVNSLYDPETDEVAAFEEQVGCHGGLGGFQTQPFVLVPSGWWVPDEPIVGAESIYEIFRHRLDEAVLSPEEIAARDVPAALPAGTGAAGVPAAAVAGD